MSHEKGPFQSIKMSLSNHQFSGSFFFWGGSIPASSYILEHIRAQPLLVRHGHRALVMSLAVKAPARPLLVVMGGSASQNKALKDIWAVGDVGYGRVLVRVRESETRTPW